MYQLNENDYAAYYRPYMEGLPSSDILPFLENQMDEVMRFLRTIPESKWDFAYAEGKWTIREVLGHVTDSEIIFGCRALCFARGEQQSLPGYDENEYVREGRFRHVSYQEIIQIWLKTRELNLVLFESIDEKGWNQNGIANGNTLKAGAVPFIIAGHVRHHMRIIKERYLV
ncbi:MAG: DinB family protein [Bacteroidetes bacterium]|nr:DinB family protein [Bacteroidota bacterium]